MKITAKQKALTARIESLTGAALDAIAIKRNCIALELPDSKSCSESRFFDLIFIVCRDYNLGRVESGGVGRLNIIF